MDIQHLKHELSPIFREHGVRRASVFGSVSRGEDHGDSDIDLIVKLGRPMGLVGFVGMVEKMEKTLGRKIDLLTEGGINRFIEPYIKSDTTTIYEE